MPQPPYAKLLVSRNGGAVQTGGIACAFGDVIQLSSEDTSHPQAFRYEIYSYYSQASFPCPAGWSTAADGTYYYAAGATPPAFTVPSSHGDWQDILLRLTINNGDPGTSGLPDSQFVDESTALRLVSDAGIADVAYLGGTQFNPKGPTGDLQNALRALAIGLGVGFGTGAIADHAVTYAKIQQVAATSLIGNPTGSLANAQAISVGGGLEFSGSAMQRSALTGDVTATAGSNATTIANNAVTFAKAQQIGVGLVGNDTGTANQKLITLGTAFAFSGGALTLASGGTALTSLATISDQRLLGNVSGSTASPSALTATQVTAFLNVATTTLKGLVPAPLISSGRVLKDDLTWGTVSGTFTSPANPADNGKLSYANAGTNNWTANVFTDGTRFLYGATTSTLGFHRYGKNPGFIIGYLAHDGTTSKSALNVTGDGSTFTNIQVGDVDATTGNDTIYLMSKNNVILWPSGVNALLASKGGVAITQQAATSGTAPVLLSVSGALHTGLTASTEPRDVTFGLNRTVTMLVGDYVNSRAFKINAPTWAFGGASNVGVAATLSINGAPVAGTNATFTNTAAVQIETGALAFGTTPATATTKIWSSTGLIRMGANVLALAFAGALGAYDIPAVTTNGSDQLIWGGSGTNSPVANIYNTRSTGTHEFQIGGTAKWTLSSTQLDLHSTSIVNVTAINGVRLMTGVLGAAIGDTDTTISVAGGRIYQQTAANTSNHTITIADTGAADGDGITISRNVTDAFTLTINNSVGTLLYRFAAGVKDACDFIFDSGSGKFKRGMHMPIA